MPSQSVRHSATTASPSEFYFFCLCRSTSPTQRPAAYLVGLAVHQTERTPLSSPARAYSSQPSFYCVGTSRLSFGTILFCHSIDISCFWGLFQERTQINESERVNLNEAKCTLLYVMNGQLARAEVIQSSQLMFSAQGLFKMSHKKKQQNNRVHN